MNINIVRDNLKDYVNKEVFIKYSLGRNKVEKFNGRILKLYNFIFTVENIDTKELKSFTYSDVITKTLKLYYK